MEPDPNTARTNYLSSSNLHTNDRPPNQLGYTQMIRQLESADKQSPTHLYTSDTARACPNPHRQAPPGLFPPYGHSGQASALNGPESLLDQKVKHTNPHDRQLPSGQVQDRPAFVAHFNVRDRSDPMTQINGQELMEGRPNFVAQNGRSFPMRLGDKFVRSVVCKKEVQEEGSMIEEQSQLLPSPSENSSLSHFEPVELSGLVQPNPQPQQPQKNPTDYVILTSLISPRNENQFQQKSKEEDSPIELREELNPKFFSKNPQAGVVQGSTPRNQQFNLGMNIGPVAGLRVREEDLKKGQMLESRIIRRTFVENPVKDKDNIKNSVKQMEVQNRMKLTHDPKITESQFKAVANGGNHSQPNRHSIKPANKQQKQSKDFIDEDSLHEESGQNEDHFSAKLILEKLNRLENAVRLMAQNSDRPSENSNHKINKNSIYPKSPKARGEKPIRHRITSLNRIVPEQLLDFNMSSIEYKAEKQRQLNKQFKKNTDLGREISELKKRIKQLQKKQPQGETKSNSKSKPIRRVISSDGHYFPAKKELQLNFKQMDPQTSLGKRLPRQNSDNMRNEQSSERTATDAELEQLEQRLPIFDRIPSIQASQNKVVQTVYKIFDYLGFNVNKYGGFEMRRTRQGIQFELNRGPTLIWSKTSEFYIGNLKMRRGLLEREGKGIGLIPNSYIYQGDFKKNLKHGFGIMIDAANGEKYKGFWKDNLYHGRGKLYTNQSRYDGYFVDGVQEGQGFELFCNGDTYEGEYRAGKYHGRGKYTWKINKSIYEGDFKLGYMEGQGIWKNAKGDSYQGQYYKGMKHGFGVYRWCDGRVFKGQYEHGHRVNHRKPERRIIEPERTLTQDLNESSELHLGRFQTFRSLDRKRVSFNSLQQFNQRKFFHSPFRRI